MYARNNDARRDCREICPPENYSGNAFPDRSRCDETDAAPEMKTDNCKPENPPECPPPPNEKMCGNFGSDEFARECHPDECRKDQPPPCQDDRNNVCDDRRKPEPPCPPRKNDGLLDRLFGRFKGMRKEDLLIIGLVLFLILGNNDENEHPCDDDGQDNNDILLILALILLLS